MLAAHSGPASSDGAARWPAQPLRVLAVVPDLHCTSAPRLPLSAPQALFKSTVQLVLLPTLVGLLANEYFKKQVGAQWMKGYLKRVHKD